MKKLILLAGSFAVMGSASATAISRPLLMTASIVAAAQDSPRDSEPARDSHDQEASVPLTDRTPWLVHLILISPGVAVAWILFVLVRAKVKEGGKPTPELHDAG